MNQSPDTILVITYGQEHIQRLFNLRLKEDRAALIKLQSWLTSHGETFKGEPLKVPAKN